MYPRRLRRISRRSFLTGAATLAVGAVAAEGLAQEAFKEIGDLQPGEFTWRPERQPSGPVAVVVYGGTDERYFVPNAAPFVV
jgi:hypothetical protein